jgi:hypothetical protein
MFKVSGSSFLFNRPFVRGVVSSLCISNSGRDSRIAQTDDHAPRLEARKYNDRLRQEIEACKIFYQEGLIFC